MTLKLDNSNLLCECDTPAQKSFVINSLNEVQYFFSLFQFFFFYGIEFVDVLLKVLLSIVALLPVIFGFFLSILALLRILHKVILRLQNSDRIVDNLECVIFLNSTTKIAANNDWSRCDWCHDYDADMIKGKGEISTQLGSYKLLTKIVANVLKSKAALIMIVPKGVQPKLAIDITARANADDLSLTVGKYQSSLLGLASMKRKMGLLDLTLTKYKDSPKQFYKDKRLQFKFFGDHNYLRDC